MAGKQDKFRIGAYFLARRSDGKNDVWYRCWHDRRSRQVRRASLGTTDLEEAKLRLAQWVAANVRPARREAEEVTVAELCLTYFESYAKDLPSGGVIRRNLAIALERLPEGLAVADFGLDVQQALARRLRAEGYHDGTVKRIFTDLRSALRRAWKQGAIPYAPAFLQLSEGEPRERILSVEEIAQLWDQDMGQHLRMFLLLLLSTAARPKAVLELTRFQVDLRRGLIDLNPAGRRQTKKRRPVLPLLDCLRPWVDGAGEGHLVQYRGRPVKKINAAWRNARHAAGLDDDVVPYSIRHTIASEMQARAVPELEIAGFLGHTMPNVRSTGRYVKFRPDHLRNAAAAVAALISEIGRVAARPISKPLTDVRATSVPPAEAPGDQIPGITGAGDEIRTHDPNLGKVVLYP